MVVIQPWQILHSLKGLKAFFFYGIKLHTGWNLVKAVMPHSPEVSLASWNIQPPLSFHTFPFLHLNFPPTSSLFLLFQWIFEGLFFCCLFFFFFSFLFWPSGMNFLWILLVRGWRRDMRVFLIELRQYPDRVLWGWKISSTVLTHFYFKLGTSTEGLGGGTSLYHSRLSSGRACVESRAWFSDMSQVPEWGLGNQTFQNTPRISHSVSRWIFAFAIVPH